MASKKKVYKAAVAQAGTAQAAAKRHPRRPLDPRGKDAPRETPKDPRPRTDPDAVAIERRIQKADEDVEGRIAAFRTFYQDLWTDFADPVPPPEVCDETKADDCDFADEEYRAYRFTRDGEIVNEEMGYGEKIRETLWSSKGKTVRVSQRTKTGRQRLMFSPTAPPPKKD